MAQVQAGDKINKITPSPSKPHSNFNLSFDFGLTPKFGLNTPFFSREFVVDDGPIRIQPNCSTRSYTMRAPVFGNIKKHVAFYQVPLQAILPNNWEKIVKNANHGNDVQGDSDGGSLVSALNGVNCVISGPSYTLLNLLIDDFSVFKTKYTASGISYGERVRLILLFVARWEMWFSNGNLLSHLGVHYGHLLKFNMTPSGSSVVTRTYSFDAFCQLLLGSIININFSVNNGEHDCGYGSGASHIRRALDFIRSHEGPFSVSFDRLDGSPQTLDITLYSISKVINAADPAPLNFGRCVAYQIVNAHFYTNDRIDYVNTADLYRQYIGSLITEFRSEVLGVGDSISMFYYNGIGCQFDFLSGKYMHDYIYQMNDTSVAFDSDNYWLYYHPYYNAIFGFNYSLRYLDYFSGSRPRNLAISGPNTPTNVEVVAGKVDVINITRSIVAQRFLNAVARVPSNIEAYQEKILGRKPDYDWHNPKYLFSYDYDIFTQEIENTGSAQMTDPNSVTSVMRGSAQNLEFTMSFDRQSFVVGVETFDIKRFYCTTQDKNTMAVDRFDMFVPELQYIGDQPLKLSELVAGTSDAYHFGYQFRDTQFKETYSECCGGFVENLPGWLYKFDLDFFKTKDFDEMHISPEFIRSVPEEIDEFFVSLTGMTMASYFHFIEVWNIKVSANRPMIAAPQIL